MKDEPSQAVGRSNIRLQGPHRQMGSLGKTMPLQHFLHDRVKSEHLRPVTRCGLGNVKTGAAREAGELFPLAITSIWT